MTSNKPDVLSLTETAALLGVSTRTVFRYLASGRLTALRDAGLHRVWVARKEAEAERLRRADRTFGSRFTRH